LKKLSPEEKFQKKEKEWNFLYSSANFRVAKIRRVHMQVSTNHKQQKCGCPLLTQRLHRAGDHPTFWRKHCQGLLPLLTAPVKIDLFNTSTTMLHPHHKINVDKYLKIIEPTYRIHCWIHTVNLKMQEKHPCRCNLPRPVAIFLEWNSLDIRVIRLDTFWHFVCNISTLWCTTFTFIAIISSGFSILALYGYFRPGSGIIIGFADTKEMNG